MAIGILAFGAETGRFVFAEISRIGRLDGAARRAIAVKIRLVRHRMDLLETSRAMKA